MSRHLDFISHRLSLRAPQRESLEILGRLCEILPLQKGADTAAQLESVRAEFPSVTDFERDFPSLCFALATGVGKTRLMGAFIAYLHAAEGIRHFFVLAPSLTIYEKLIADFTPNTPKYVFQGISDFVVNPPEIITGENYVSGRGIRRATLFGTDGVHVNIFNIAKITKSEMSRFRSLQECIGQSYFEYLSQLDDLVLLMDESHRYRASAGMRAIGELSPILGLELTATPQVERAGGIVAFKNVIYSYPLSSAMSDGFVKEPAVGTRQNFDAKNYDAAGLEKLKLEDGVRIHEETKVQLEVFARENDKPIVKPFVLVIARDTDHANALMAAIEDEALFEGRYKGKVITVHSKLKGEEADETVEQLVNVENADNPTEIVIHVNMLKEGWDVRNLYTIVPLRTASSQTLVEQSICRGLRLPYGERTGVADVDRLTIVAHDRFQEIIDYANRPDSLIRGGMKTVFVPTKRIQAKVVPPAIVQEIEGTAAIDGHAQASLFASPGEREAALATLDVISREFERLPRGADLASPAIQEQIVEQVRAIVTPVQAPIEGTSAPVDVVRVVARTIERRNELSIDIPRITVQPVGDVTRGYRAFTLDLAGVMLQPVDSEILIHELHRRQQHRLTSGTGIVAEDRPEDYLVRGLIDFNDICYDDHADLLYELAAQVVAHLRTYLADEDQVLNVLQYHQRHLVNLVHVQMQQHYEERAARYKTHVSKGFTTLRPNNYTAAIGEAERDFRAPVDDRSAIRTMLFSGFSRCLYPIQKFDSDPERRLAVIADREGLKWFKPAKGTFQIHYAADEAYEPDFVVETATHKLLCEPKDASEMADPIVQAKARAAAVYCQRATRHELEHGGKPWVYLLIPHDAIADNKSLKGLMNSYAVAAEAHGAGESRGSGELFERVTPSDDDKYRTCVPLLTLKAAAGRFGEQQPPEDEHDLAWVAVHTRHRLARGMFVAKVVGRSMEPAIPSGSHCLFSAPVTGTRQGRIVLVRLRDAADPETGERFCVKRYESVKKQDGDAWQHEVITLKSLNSEFQPIVLSGAAEGKVDVVAALVEVLQDG